VRAVQLDFKGQKDRLLVERVDYDGQNGSVSIIFRPNGIRTLGAERDGTVAWLSPGRELAAPRFLLR
jgi:hypothetical protein